MKRIWLPMAISVLAIGCGQQTTVVETDKAAATANVQATATVEKDGEKAGSGELQLAGDENQFVAKQDKVAADETTGNTADGGSDADTAEQESEATPQELLGALQEKEAEPEEFLAFAREHAGTNIGFTALQLIGQRRDLAAGAKAQLVEILKNEYLPGGEEGSDSAIGNTQVMTAAMMIMGMGSSKDQDQVVDVLMDRFLKGKESFDATVSRVAGLIMQQGSAEAKQKLADQVLANFADDDGILGFMQQLSRGIPSPSTVEFVKSLTEKTSKDSIKGTAMITLAQIYNSVPDTKGYVNDEGFRAAFPEETIEFIKNFNPDEYADEIVGLLTRVKEASWNAGRVSRKRVIRHQSSEHWQRSAGHRR